MSSGLQRLRRTLPFVALIACGDHGKAPAPLPPPPPAAVVAATPSRPEGFTIPTTTKQLLVAVPDDWSSTHASLVLWQRGASWTKVEEWPVVLGKHGTAWGVGLHPTRPGPTKREGDGKSPAGVFALRESYGYASDAPKAWKLPYEPAADLLCVNDPASDHYTQIVDRKQVASDWESAEWMRRHDELYHWVIDIAHNPDAKPGAGSCIFFHVWSGPESSTIGCTAMEKPKLETLLAKLDPAQHPLYVLLPRAEYRAIADAWGLPAQ